MDEVDMLFGQQELRAIFLATLDTNLRRKKHMIDVHALETGDPDIAEHYSSAD